MLGGGGGGGGVLQNHSSSGLNLSNVDPNQTP